MYEVGGCLLEQFTLTDTNHKESKLGGAYQGNLRSATNRKRHTAPEAELSHRSSRRSSGHPEKGV